MPKNKSISFQNILFHCFRFTTLFPTFMGFWAGLFFSIYIYFTTDVGWEIIFIPCFFMIAAYPYGLSIAAITGAFASNFTSLSKQKFVCLIALTSSTITVIQSGFFYIISTQQQMKEIVGDDEPLIVVPSLLNPTHLPKLTALMLIGTLIGGYFFGLFYIKRFGSK